ncbi:MAG: Asp23/Gls24 family envelope stress response protein [Peptococcales bacterium]|jgi:ABC-type dipeptide/oligopeptide/nickel transport system ATPase component
MEVFALVGPSGTGKSHKAILVASEKGIDTIIDDGLLISDGKKIAGFSAKREMTRMQAVKRAIFMDKEHADIVKKEMKKLNPDKILILGTSVKMIDKIIQALDLPEPQNIIYIDEISSEIEIKKAQKMRNEFGKHVIPLPTIEIKKDFPNYLIDPLQFFFKKKDTRRVGEKSIIRPRFNMLGKLLISENVIDQYTKAAAGAIPEIKQVSKVNVAMNEEGVAISVELIILYGTILRKVARKYQKATIQLVENLTGLNVLYVDIRVKTLYVE